MNPILETCSSIDRHVHLEGSLDASWVRTQAALAGVPIPDSFEALQRGEARAFEGFVEAFLFAMDFLRDAKAIKAAVYSAVKRLGPCQEGPRGMDLWVTPNLLVRRKGLLSLDELWRGLDEGIAEARRQGVSIAVVADAVNHFGPEDGDETLDLILPERPPWLVGFSTGGLERVPFRQWAPVFERARKAGLRLAAHAGENGPGSQVREAVVDAGVERIVHGVRAASDPVLLEFLADRRIPVDVCISSNRALVADLRPHPLSIMLEAGLRCALGTDDPGIIPCTLPSEWDAARSLGLSEDALETLKRNTQEDAWCV